MTTRLTVLLAEDEPTDQLLARRAIRSANLHLDLQIVNDGTEAVAYLSGCDQFSDRAQYPLPALIFLDLKMPKKTGFEVLEWIRTHRGCKNIPVVVLSSSPLLADIERAYELGVDAYLVKPMGLDELSHLFKTTIKLFTSKPS